MVFILKFVEGILKVDFPYLSEFKWLDNFLLPFGGIIFYFAFFESIKNILKKNSRTIFFIDYLFLSLILITLLDIHKHIYFLNSLFLLRDFFNFLSIILFGKFILSIKSKKFIKLIISISLLASFLHIFQTINYKFENHISNSFNYLKKNDDYKTSNLHNFFMDIPNNQLKKTYLSNEVWNLFDGNNVGAIDLNKSILNGNDFFNINIFFFNDFLKYKIYPFNLRFKNANKNLLRISKEKMYSAIEPRFDEINNEFFFNIFNIGYLLIFEDELNKINNSKFKVINKIKFNNKKLLFLELIDKNKKIILINQKFENKSYLNCLKNKDEALARCLIFNSDKKFDKTEEIIFDRIAINKYKIINKSNMQKNFILPFLYDKSWKAENKKIQNLNNSLMFVKIESNSEEVIFYRDYTRTVLKALSIISIIILIILSFISKKIILNKTK